jgi:hypothetical protein
MLLVEKLCLSTSRHISLSRNPHSAAISTVEHSDGHVWVHNVVDTLRMESDAFRKAPETEKAAIQKLILETDYTAGGFYQDFRELFSQS